MDCGDARGEEAFSAEKTRSRSQKKRNREWGELWTHLFFSKKSYWSVANLQWCIKFCCTTVWLSYTHKNIFFSYSFSCGLSLNIEYSSLRSTVGLCCFSFLCFPNFQSSTHHTLPHDNLISWPSLALDELSHPLLLRKPLDTYQNREIKQRIVLGLDFGGSHR